MGGYNSGGGRGALKSDAFWRLDIAELHKQGLLNPGRYTVSWRDRNGETLSSLKLRSAPDELCLIYRQKGGGDTDWEQVTQTIKLDWSEQHFGGKRVWFRCPKCHSRRRILYGRERYWCRQCHGMVYESQYDPYPQLPWSRCHRVRERLGGEAGFGNAFPRRPKGMHRKTYQRLLEEDLRASALLDLGYTLSASELRAAWRAEYRERKQ